MMHIWHECVAHFALWRTFCLNSCVYRAVRHQMCVKCGINGPVLDLPLVTFSQKRQHTQTALTLEP